MLLIQIRKSREKVEEGLRIGLTMNIHIPQIAGHNDRSHGDVDGNGWWWLGESEGAGVEAAEMGLGREGGGDFIDKRATQLGPCLTHSPGYDYPGGLKALESSNRQVAKELPRVAVESSPFQTNRKRE
jgi:hypothetical protein